MIKELKEMSLNLKDPCDGAMRGAVAYVSANRS